MKIRVLVACALLVIAFPVQAQFSPYAGIWRGLGDSSKYYSIQINGNQIVFIDLPGLTENGEILPSSFHGEIEFSNVGFVQARLYVRVEQPGLPSGLSIFFDNTQPEASVSWGCPPEVENCAQFVQRIRKIF